MSITHTITHTHRGLGWTWCRSCSWSLRSPSPSLSCLSLSHPPPHPSLSVCLCSGCWRWAWRVRTAVRCRTRQTGRCRSCSRPPPAACSPSGARRGPPGPPAAASLWSTTWSTPTALASRWPRNTWPTRPSREPTHARPRACRRLHRALTPHTGSCAACRAWACSGPPCGPTGAPTAPCQLPQGPHPCSSWPRCRAASSQHAAASPTSTTPLPR